MSNVPTIMKQGRKHTRQVSRELLDRWKIFWMWINGDEGHHLAGRAVDLMTLTANQGQLRNAVGNEIAAYARKHHKRLGIQYVIWRQRIWNASRSDDVSRVGWSTWRVMEDRGSITKNHMDHVHISFLGKPPTYRLLAASPATKSAVTAHAGEIRYTVKRGDTLAAIGSRHGTTVKAIVKRNNIPNPDVIRVGQVLVIPSRTTTRPVVRYTVKAGDTLAAIASRHGTTVSAIAKRNNIPNPDVIRVGQVLVIA